MAPWRTLQALLASLLAAATLYLCLFSHLGALGLIGPDEPRYAWVARTMAETGDWVTPSLYGKPWFEKPPLYYWSAAVAFRVFGVSDSAARLPSALAALIAALALAWVALRLYGPTTAWATLLVFPTCVGVVGFARAASPDMIFSATLALAMVAALDVTRNPGPPEEGRLPRLSLVLFGVWLGAAVLAKGPAAIALAGGSMGLWGLATRGWRRAFRLLHPAAVVPFCIVALPWYVLCEVRNPGFASEFFLLHNVERYLTPMFQHPQPWWFFGLVLLLGLLPWTALLVGTARQGWKQFREGQWKNSPGLFLGCWAAFPVVFFSFSQSKLPGYILPAIPPLALLIARRLVRRAAEDERFSRWLLAAVGGTWVALALNASYWLKRLPAEWVLENGQRILYWVCAMAVMGALIAVIGVVKRWQAALVLSAALAVCLIEASNLQFLPGLDPYLSARQAGQKFAGHERPEALGVFRLPRAWEYGLNFYLEQELPEWTASNPRDTLVYTNGAGVMELARLGRRIQVIERPAPGICLVAVRCSECR